MSGGIVVGGLFWCAWNGEGTSHGTLVIEQETFVTGIEIDVVYRRTRKAADGAAKVEGIREGSYDGFEFAAAGS